MERVGLFIGRLQPLHVGHCKIINTMIQDYDTVIIGLGSAQKSRERRHPWTIDERMEMIKCVYGDRVKIKPINDLGAITPNEWVDYVRDTITKIGLPEPTDYYTGSEADAVWYKDYFDQPERGRNLHIADRSNNPVPSATELRGFLELRDNGWKKWIPAVNHYLVMATFPEEFKVPRMKN